MPLPIKVDPQMRDPIRCLAVIRIGEPILLRAIPIQCQQRHHYLSSEIGAG
jgi:hypothetical protein